MTAISSLLSTPSITWLRERAASYRRLQASTDPDTAATWQAAASAIDSAADDLAAGRPADLDAPAEAPPAAAAPEPVALDLNATKRLARSVARRAGVTILIEGADSPSARRGIRKGDPLPSPTEEQPDRAYYRCSYDFDMTAERQAAEIARVQGAVDAMRRAGLSVAWSGDLHHCLSLYV
jgi:hypothetical protein